MSNEKINVLFPIEISNRELDFRLFLANLCARDDLRIFIGQTNAIYRLAKNIENGIYVGKNIFVNLFPGDAQQLHRYQTIKKKGFTLVHLDEEGGVMKGDEARWRKWLAAKLDVRVLAGDDYLCTWGSWQRDFYLAQEPKCAEKTFVTGHPRFDLYKPQWRAFYADDAKKLQARFGDFVLINTNFAWANNRNGIARPFSEKWNNDAADTARRLDHVAEWANNARILIEFVELVSQLSAARPDLQFVLRPHPSENAAFYEAIFGGVANVKVFHEGSIGAWLLACRALIHDGCTTGLEAHFADCPVVTYKGIEDPRFDLWLPNLFGEKCRNVEEVLRVLADTKQRHIAEIDAPEIASTRGALSAEEKLAEPLIANFGCDSFAAVRDVVWRAADEKSASGGASGYNAARHKTLETLRVQLRALRYRTGLKEKRRVEDGVLDKFSGFAPDDIANRLARVQQLTGRAVSYPLHGSCILTVEN